MPPWSNTHTAQAPRLGHSPPCPCPPGPALTGFALLSRQLLLRALFLLLHQPHFLQQAHEAAAQGGLFLWFLLLPLQLNSWRWSRKEGVSLICLLTHLLNHSLLQSFICSFTHGCIHGVFHFFLNMSICLFIYSLVKPLSFKSATVHIFKELKETISKVLKRGMMTMTHQIENINKR